MTIANPTGYPLPSASVASGTSLVTLDTWTQNPTLMEVAVADLVAGNMGFYANRLFSMPNGLVQGGGVVTQDFYPTDLFLDADGGLAPRAPGAESALLRASRRPSRVVRPYSLAGKIEVTDEEKLRNNPMAVEQDLKRIANTFALTMETNALAAFAAFVGTLSGARDLVSEGWRRSLTNGVPNANPMQLPTWDLDQGFAMFENDKSGIRPDVLLTATNDAAYLRAALGRDWRAILADYGLTLLSTPMISTGTSYLVKSGEVGAIMFEKYLTTVTGRGPIDTYKDIFAFEARPVVIANNAASFVRITGVDGTGS